MSGGSLWDLITFFLVPRAYDVWKYKRRYRGEDSS
jgi:hypothetical protein